MCRQFVTIGSCKHHYFTGLFEKCLDAIVTSEICSGALNANDLFDETNVILNEHTRPMCDSCQPIFDQGILLARATIDLQGFESRVDQEEAEEEGKKMREEEYLLLVAISKQMKSRVASSAAKELVKHAKRPSKRAQSGSKSAPQRRGKDVREKDFGAGEHWGQIDEIEEIEDSDDVVMEEVGEREFEDPRAHVHPSRRALIG